MTHTRAFAVNSKDGLHAPKTATRTGGTKAYNAEIEASVYGIAASKCLDAPGDGTIRLIQRSKKP